MASKTILLPLGGEAQGSDTTASQSTGNWIIPTSTIKNFIPIIVSQSASGTKQIKFVKRRGFNTKMDAADTGYQYSRGFQWTGVQSTGTAPNTSRGVIVYTQEKASTDLKLKQCSTSVGTISTLGTFSTANYRCIGIQETLISGTPTLTLNVKLTSSPYGQKALYYPNGGSLTEITDSDFPSASIGDFVHLDGYAFIASTDGYIYNSDLNSISSWTANNRIAVQMVPDSLVGLAKIRNVILALGTGSIELFENRGLLSGSPLATSGATAIRMGVLHQRAMQEIDDGIIFISMSADGAGVYLWNGQGTPKKVSDALIDMNLVAYANDASNTPLAGPLPLAVASRIHFAGTMIYFGVKIVLLYINNVCYSYSPSQDLWSIFVLGTNLAKSTFFNVGPQMFAVDIENTGTNASIAYYSGGQNGTDIETATGATAFEASITTPPLSLGTGRNKRYNKIRIIGDKIEAATTPIVVSYSDDNGQNFTTWGTIDMNVNPPISLFRGGASRRRIWKFSNTSGSGCEIDAVELTYEEMSN